MTPGSRRTLPAGEGIAVPLSCGGQLRIVNVDGGQVVDLWAVNPVSPDERLSMEHTRTSLGKLAPAAGDDLYSSRRRPMLRLAQDTSPGVHDTLIAACDPERYRQLGAAPGHRNCADNLHAALGRHGVQIDRVPSPLNLFMNIPWQPDGSLEFRPSPARAGDAVVIEAVIESLVVLSACPMDLNEINNSRLGDIELEVIAAGD